MDIATNALPIPVELQPIDTEFKAADKLLEIHGIEKFIYKDGTLYAQDAQDEWTSSKERIHKTMLQLYRKQLGDWLESTRLWNKVYYMMGIIMM